MKGNAAKKNSEKDHRCFCGKLLARITEAGVQLKCRRCKRLVLVSWDERVTA